MLYQKSQMLTILKLDHVKNIKDPEFCLDSNSGNLKRIYSAIYFWSKPRAGAIRLVGIQHFFPNLTTNIIFCPRYPEVLMVVFSLAVLSEKNNFGKGYPRRNLKINDENQRKLILLWFWAMISSLTNKMIFWNSYLLKGINPGSHNDN